MRRCPRSTKTTSAVTPTASTNRNSTEIGDNSPVRASSNELPMAEGRPATIPPKMISEMPLPIPRSVTCSPSHIKNMVPHTSVFSAVTRNAGPGSITTDLLVFVWRCSVIAMPAAWKVASTTVKYRVYCVILRRPDSPSFFSCSSLGQTTVNSWMMIEAEIYGMIPRANTATRDKAPPENMLNMSMMVPRCWSNRAASAVGLMPGTGIAAPIRKTINAPSTNSKRCLSSAHFVISPRGLAMGIEARALTLRSTAGCLDGRPRTLGHRDAPQIHFARQFAGQDDLGALRLLRHDVRRLQRQQIDDIALNLAELVQTHFRRETRHRRIETHLGQTALQRHLAAFEADLMKAASARRLTLVAAAAGLAEAGADAATAALGRLLGARCRFDGIQAHDLSFLDLQHVGDLVDHAAIGGGVVYNYRVLVVSLFLSFFVGVLVVALVVL